MNQQIIPFIATFDDNFVELAKVCFLSLLKYHDNAKIYIINSNLSEDSKAELLNIESTIEFIQSPESELNVFDLTSGEGRWTPEVFNKVECINMPEFAEYDKVVVIDVDTLFLGNIQEYFDNYANGNIYVAPIMVTDMNTLGHQMDDYFKLLDYKIYLCNSGFQILNLKRMREDNIYKRCMHGFKTVNRKLLKQLEEDVLYSECYPYIQQLPKPQFTLNGEDEVTKDTIFIHYVGRNKPHKKDCNYRKIWSKSKKANFKK